MDFHNLVLSENEYSPLSLLEAYLRLFSKGTFKDQITTETFADAREAKVGNLQLLLKTFGEEGVRIWTALMLKKRIVVYHENMNELLELLAAMPSLVLHRPCDFMRLFVNFDNALETKDLSVGFNMTIF